MSLPDEMGLVAVLARFVNHLGSSIVSAFESSHLEITRNPLNKLSVPVDIVSKVNRRLCHEQYHLNILQLAKNNLPFLDFNWFQML